MTVRLLVRNLNPRTTRKQLERYFSSAGFAVSAAIPLEPETGLSRGYGLVEFETEEQAERALLVFAGRLFASRRLQLVKASDAQNPESPLGVRVGENRKRSSTGGRRRASE